MASKLTNKFTKSVLEREQKEQKNIEPTIPVTARTQAPAAKAIEPPVADIAVQAPVVTTEPVTPVAQPIVTQQQPAASKPVKKAAAPAVMNLDAFLNPSENRQAKNKTFYLDTVVIDAIKQAATANHMAESKLVNDILKKVLGA